LAERFRGALVGALVGDCLGAHFECQHENLVPESLLASFFTDLEDVEKSR
jgi:ADP-ribosylglycohydrolase